MIENSLGEQKLEVKMKRSVSLLSHPSDQVRKMTLNTLKITITQDRQDFQQSFLQDSRVCLGNLLWFSLRTKTLVHFDGKSSFSAIEEVVLLKMYLKLSV